MVLILYMITIHQSFLEFVLRKCSVMFQCHELLSIFILLTQLDAVFRSLTVVKRTEWSNLGGE